MNRNDAMRSIQKQLNVVRQLLEAVTDLANAHSINFVWRDAPFEARYNGHTERWETGSDYWTESGCTIGYEEFDDLDNSWASSSANC